MNNATYLTHDAAEIVVRHFADSDLPISQVSIIEHSFETCEDIQGCYHSADAALAGMMAWALGFLILPVVGAVMMAGTLGFFVFPVVGAMMVLGLLAVGFPRRAIKYQERL